MLAFLILVSGLPIHLTICAFVAVIDGMVSFQAGIVFFRVLKTLTEAAAVGVHWMEEAILDETCQEI